MEITKSKNGILYVTKNEGDKYIDNARIKSTNIYGYNYFVVGDRFYNLLNKGNYYEVVQNEPFISFEMYSMLEKENEKYLQDIKENKDFYDEQDLNLLKGKKQYISELLNKSRIQLEKLKIIK